MLRPDLLTPRLSVADDAPTFHDQAWRTFVLAKEEHSELAASDWQSYREGLTALERRFAGQVPSGPMRRSLAEDAFFCATHWGYPAGVVHDVLEELLRHPLSITLYTYAAAEFRKWASGVSPEDQLPAQRMIEHACGALHRVDDLTRENLRRMLKAVADYECAN